MTNEVRENPFMRLDLASTVELDEQGMRGVVGGGVIAGDQARLMEGGTGQDVVTGAPQPASLQGIIWGS